MQKQWPRSVGGLRSQGVEQCGRSVPFVAGLHHPLPVLEPGHEFSTRSRTAIATFPTPWRFLVIDGRHVQGPDARGTQYRLHICMDLVQLQFVAMTVTDQHRGESLGHFPLGPGDIALADRGYGYAMPLVETVRKQADVMLRMSPAHLPVYAGDGQRVDLRAVLREQPWDTSRTIAVRIQAPASADAVCGYVHTYQHGPPPYP